MGEMEMRMRIAMVSLDSIVVLAFEVPKMPSNSLLLLLLYFPIMAKMF